MGGGSVVKSVETLRGDEPPWLRLISGNLAYEPYACLADEGPYRRHGAVDRQEDRALKVLRSSYNLSRKGTNGMNRSSLLWGVSRSEKLTAASCCRRAALRA